LWYNSIDFERKPNCGTTQEFRQRQEGKLFASDRGVAIGGRIDSEVDRAFIAKGLIAVSVTKVIHIKRLGIRIVVRHSSQTVQIVVSILIIRVAGAMVKRFSVNIVLIGYIIVVEIDDRRSVKINGHTRRIAAAPGHPRTDMAVIDKRLIRLLIFSDRNAIVCALIT